uniref:G protein gamma domain-containing protein n=1 Tax=Panagrolaimus sp. JU765 TaxID=591449 RepID=A0AC34PUZ8_9BILA
MSSRDSHTVQQARKYVEQLRREKNVNRYFVSQCAVDLIKYVQENQKDDYLISGFASDKMNPYRPKNNFQCLLL